PTTSLTTSTRAMASATNAGSPTSASGTNHTPSGKSPAAPSAMQMASRVLPTPPGPVKVSNGTEESSSSARPRDNSRSRPISGVRAAGGIAGRSDGNAVSMLLARSLPREELTLADSAVPRGDRQVAAPTSAGVPRSKQYQGPQRVRRNVQPHLPMHTAQG